jgi:hypothetical protein
MKFTLNLLVAFLFLSNVVSAQCTPDYDFFPLESNFGLSPDSLPSGAIFEEYNQNLTFVLPVDTIIDLGAPFGVNTIVFEDYHIISISLPLGLNWECNSSENDCHYDPSVSQYGCVNVSGVPMQQGLFDVDVTVIATHELSDFAGTETISFSLPLLIESGSSENNGFAMNNFSGCAPLNVEFESNNSNMATYFWDFGNGTTSTVENPGIQIFDSPGAYPIYYESYMSTESVYFLESVEIENASGWGNEWFDEDLLTDPDAYFKLFDQQGNMIYESSHYEDQNFPVSWVLDNFQLSNQTYTIEAWEEDGVSTDDDDLGSVSFSGFSSSTSLTNGDLIINLVISEIAPTPIIAFDTVFVYDSPSTPVLVYDESSQILSLNSDSLDVLYQWHFDQEVMLDHDMTYMEVSQTGYYMLSALNSTGCHAFSTDTFIVVCDNNLTPEIVVDGSILSFDNPSQLDCQWFLDGNEIFGETQNELIATQNGEYSVQLYDQWGCEYKSEDVIIDLTSLIDFEMTNIEMYPNPAYSYVELSLENINSSEVNLSVFDLQGREILSDSFNSDRFRLDISQINRGTYLVVLEFESVTKTVRLLVN